MCKTPNGAGRVFRSRTSILPKISPRPVSPTTKKKTPCRPEAFPDITAPPFLEGPRAIRLPSRHRRQVDRAWAFSGLEKPKTNRPLLIPARWGVNLPFTAPGKWFCRLEGDRLRQWTRPMVPGRCAAQRSATSLRRLGRELPQYEDPKTPPASPTTAVRKPAWALLMRPPHKRPARPGEADLPIFSVRARPSNSFIERHPFHRNGTARRRIHHRHGLFRKVF